MESKSKIFQPKVIIGSITSFVVAAVGIIAVFFPNLLNLEKSSMSEGQFLLSDDEKTHKKLWEFLDKNQGKVVQLEIAYCADFEQMTFMATKDTEQKAFYDEKVRFRAIDFTPKWFFGFGGKTDFDSYGVAENLQKFAKQHKLTLRYYETLGKPEKIDEISADAMFVEYSYVNNGWIGGNSPYPLLKKTFKNDFIGRPPVVAGAIASFHISHYGNDIYPNVTGANIENGGIGFAFVEKKTYDGGEYEDFKSKDILISHPSNKNKKYIWVVGFENVVYQYLDKTSSLAKQAKSTCKAKQITAKDIGEDEIKEEILKGWGGSTLGYIKGTFYIHEKENVDDDPGLWFLTSYILESEDYSREKFELEPFDKKDMELRKY